MTHWKADVRDKSSPLAGGINKVDHRPWRLDLVKKYLKKKSVMRINVRDAIVILTIAISVSLCHSYRVRWSETGVCLFVFTFLWPGNVTVSYECLFVEWGFWNDAVLFYFYNPWASEPVMSNKDPLPPKFWYLIIAFFYLGIRFYL